MNESGDLKRHDTSPTLVTLRVQFHTPLAVPLHYATAYRTRTNKIAPRIRIVVDLKRTCLPVTAFGNGVLFE